MYPPKSVNSPPAAAVICVGLLASGGSRAGLSDSAQIDDLVELLGVGEGRIDALRIRLKDNFLMDRVGRVGHTVRTDVVRRMGARTADAREPPARPRIGAQVTIRIENSRRVERVDHCLPLRNGGAA